MTSPAPALDTRAFRDALGWFATGVTIVTTRGPNGELVGFTANSFTSVSLDPPLVLFNLNRRANCLSIFEGCAHFAINVLAAHQTELSSRFAGSAHDKWHDVAMRLSPDGCPLLDGALASFECAVHAIHDGGDHRIFLGRVLRIAAAADGKPLLFSRGQYRSLGPLLGAPDEAAAPDATSALDNGGLFAGLEPFVSA
jgi:flavin reductase (DIM6/NTAB) family NADH-FMN oxidoreductase RutF